MDKDNIIILLLLILIIIKILNTKEGFIYVNQIYNEDGNCNDYRPDYTKCKNFPIN
jgi:hypothetical protein